MASSVFSTMGYNFDDTKYGDAIKLSSSGANTLSMVTDQMELKEWQQNDMASGAADSRTTYFQNKIGPFCTTIHTQANLILSIANTVSFNVANAVQNTMITSATNCIIAVDKFKTHTDNVSGVSDMSTFRNTDAGDIPHYDTAMGLSQHLLTILNKTDTISNSVPLLGSMTSLFVGTEMNANSIIITTDAATLNSSIYSYSDGLGNTFIASNISTTTANTIISHLDSITLFMDTRRTHDWNFFQKGQLISRRHANATRFNSMGDTQTYMINNYVGSNTLVTNLSSG